MVLFPRSPTTLGNSYDAADLMVDFVEKYTLGECSSFNFELHAEGLVGTVGLGDVRARPPRYGDVIW